MITGLFALLVASQPVGIVDLLPRVRAQPMATPLPQTRPLLPQAMPAAIPPANGVFSEDVPLSPGDRIELLIPADTERLISGFYQVNQDGRILLPFVGSLPVEGLTPDQATDLVAAQLVEQQYFRPGVQVSLRLLNYGQISLSVSGAVFDPGTVRINQQPIEIEAGSQQSLAQIPGDNPRRRLTDALSAAGGITPVADLEQVHLIRRGRIQLVDLSGIFDGSPFENPFLASGDQVYVPRGEFNGGLVRPSQITSPEILVYLSALTQPAPGNGAAATEAGGRALAYGTRFSQIMGPLNCFGGTRATNANRFAVLVRTDRTTGKTFVFDRPVEDLIRKSSGEADNPFLMSGDLVACYDADATNVRDLFRTLGDILLLPFTLFRF